MSAKKTGSKQRSSCRHRAGFAQTARASAVRAKRPARTAAEENLALHKCSVIQMHMMDPRVHHQLRRQDLLRCQMSSLRKQSQGHRSAVKLRRKPPWRTPGQMPPKPTRFIKEWAKVEENKLEESLQLRPKMKATKRSTYDEMAIASKACSSGSVATQASVR